MKISGEKIKKIREEKGYTRAALSRSSGISIRTLEEWEAGRRNPRSIDNIYALCNALNINITEVISSEALNHIALNNSERIFDESEDEMILLQKIDVIYNKNGITGILKLMDRFIYNTGIEKSLEIVKEFIDESNQD